MPTQLYFRYSDVYDQTFAGLAGDTFDYSKVGEKYEFVKEFSEYWQSFNNTIFSYYKSLGLDFPDFWIAYFIESRKGLIPFSDPLTIFINEDKDKVVAELVHELCHSLFIHYENENEWNKVYSSIESKFGSENFITKVHLIINVFTYFGLLKIFSKDKVLDLIALEKNYPGLEKAWEIIDSKESVLNSMDPYEALQKLLS